MQNNSEPFQQAEQFFIELIREVMKAKGIGQAELAQAAGLHQSHISRMLSGKFSSTFITYARVLNALGLRIELAQTQEGDWFEKAMAEMGRRKPEGRDN